MALIGDVVLCLELVQNIYDGSKMLHETWANCHRLGERTLIFTEILEKYKNNPHLLTPLIQSHIAGFKQTLIDIEEFIRKYRKQTVSKAVTKVLFRNTLAREVELLNSRLNDYAISLGVIQSIDYESKRAEDVEDTRRTFERSVSQVIDQISTHGGDTLSALEELEHDIARNTETMQEILAILSHLPVSHDDIQAIERDTKVLRDMAHHRHEELVATLQSVESKVDDVRRLLHVQDERDAAIQQTKAYVDQVKALLLPAADIHVLTVQTTTGSFGVYDGRMGSSTAVALKTTRSSATEHTARTTAAGTARSLLEQCQRLEYEALVLRSFAQSPQVVRLFGLVYGHGGVNVALPRDLLCEYLPAGHLAVSTSPALVVERAPLGSLGERLTPGVARTTATATATTTHEAVSWLLHIAEAVEFLAQRQCLHTAIEPAHVLLFPQGLAKLTGFGRCLRLDAATQTLHPAVSLWADAVPPPEASSTSVSLKVPSFLRPWEPSAAVDAVVPDLRQLYYRAPEWTAYLDALSTPSTTTTSSLLPAVLSHTIDVYSLGRIGLQLLRLPLSGADAALSPGSDLVGVRAAVKALCDEACHEDSRRRPSPVEVHRRLRSLWETLPSPPSAPPQPAVAPPAAAVASDATVTASVAATAAAAVSTASGAASTVSSLSAASAFAPSQATVTTASTASGGGSLRSLRSAMRTQLRYRTGGVPDAVDDASGRVLWRERDVHAARVKCLHLLQSTVATPSGGDGDSGVTTVATGATGGPRGDSDGDRPVDRLLATGSYDATVKVWQVRYTGRGASAGNGDGDSDGDGRETFVCLQTCAGHGDNVTALGSLWLRPSDAGDPPVSGDDHDDDDGGANDVGEREYLVSASEDRTVKLWRVRWPRRRTSAAAAPPPVVQAVRTFTGHSHGVFSVVGLPEAMLASGSWDRSIRLWDALTGDCLRVLLGHDKTAMCLAWSSTVSRLVSGGADRTLRVWDVAADDSGPVVTLTGHTDAVTAVRFLDEQRAAAAVVSSSLDKTLRLWDVASGQCLRELRGHRQVVLCVAPLRQGAYVVSGDLRGDYCVWNTASGAQETQLLPPSESPSSSYADAVVCIDDRRGHLVTTGDDHRLRLWLPVT